MSVAPDPDPLPPGAAAPSSAWFGPGLCGSQEQEVLAFLGVHGGVAVLQWPRDASHIPTLAATGLPRLLLVHPSLEPPPAEGVLQLALPYSSGDREITHALATLSQRAARRRALSGRPVIDESGSMWAGDGRVPLPPGAQRLAGLLVGRFERPVDDSDLMDAEGPVAPITRQCLNGRLARLSQLVNPLGLEVAATRGGGHIMRWCAS
ncbi:MAG TPA: hypothetical protein VEI83_00730 [Acidimicrobiales bacterium]|nr:hypothetical protein [Acidimicrobiales bacterium]